MNIDFFRKNETQTSNSLEERLNKHPQLKTRVEALLNVVENSENHLENANLAEQKVIAEIRQMGQEVLEDWAIQQADRITKEFRSTHPVVKKQGKKKLFWHSTFGKIEVKEQLFLENGYQQRPFSQRASIHCRGYSIPLQRVITDFGADNSFGKVDNKLKEHYGISLPTSAIQALTEKHASLIDQQQELKTEIPKETLENLLLVETDGSFVPIVTTTNTNETEETSDRRKNRTVAWKEARLCLAHPQGSCSPVFGGTRGTPRQIGSHLLHLAIEAGLNQSGKVHVVGDGASWIIKQIQALFGTQSHYLIDFYHLCDYLAAAAKVCDSKASQTWFKLQKERMKNNELHKVLLELEPFLEPKEVPDEKAPGRCCFRYLKNRPNQFNYQAAKEAGLPIASGEIVRCHRYIIQERLKLPGAWWNLDNARAMISLRLFRVNPHWSEYWDNLMPKVA
jgi:hypothetical protein